MKYFTNTIEYPKNILEDVLPWNEEWIYVSSTFLNGFINYATPISAFMLDRYVEMDEKSKTGFVAHLRSDDYRYEWYDKTFYTKRDLFEAATKPGVIYHTDMNILRDDVLILSKINDGMYIYFWYDMDVSDCAIGRFKTDDTEEEVIEEFTKFVKGLNYGSHELPMHFFQGWMKG